MNLNQDDIIKIAQIVPGIISIYRVVGVSLEPLYFSENVAALSGLSTKEYKKYIGSDASVIIIPEDKELVAKNLVSVVSNGIKTECVYRIYNKQSNYIWVHATAQKIGTFDGCPVILATFINTTLETNVQANLLNHTSNAVYVIDADNFEILYANEVALKRWGKSEYNGKQCFKFIGNLRTQCPWCALLNLKDSSIHIEETYVPTKDKWFQTDCEQISWYERKAYAIYSTDITQAKREQLILAQSNETLKATINNIPVGICVYKQIGKVITCIAANPYLARTKGIVHSIPGKELDDTFFSYIYPGEEDTFKKNFYLIFENGYNVFDYRTLDGHVALNNKANYIWLHIEGYSTTQSDDSKIAYVCYTNITREKEDEQEANRLRRVEEEHYTHTVDGIISALPKTIGSAHLDLTQNYYSNFRTLINDVSIPKENGSVDYLFSFLSSIMYDDKARNTFNTKFNRISLINSFKYGQNNISFDYQHRHNNNTIEWETMFLTLVRNPKNEDIEAVLYAVNSEDRITIEQINKHILAQDYDNVAIISTINGSINFVSMNEPETTPNNCTKYDDDIKDAFPRVIVPEEVDAAIKKLCLENIVAELKTKDFFLYSFTVVDPNNNRYRKQARYSYLDETKQKILLVRTDVTDATRNELEQKRKLEKALEAAEKANEMKSVFLSTVSHDMRTPLNGIIGYTTLALQQKDTEVTHSYLEKIKTASDSLLLLINDTLDLARIENGNDTLKQEPLNSYEFINSVITTVKPSLTMKNINFITKLDGISNLWLKFDKMRMEKILLNLLSNAAKYTPENGSVTLKCNCSKAEENKATISITVSDTGCGMSKEFLPKAFEPFTQERTAATANTGGSGLGLSIVKKLIEMMNGTIEVQSVLGKGTTFNVHLTFEIVSPQIKVTPELVQSDNDYVLSGKHILLCEDNAVNREIAIALLETKKLIVDVATNGKEGVELFRKSKPGTYDAILMDIRMPIMNGYDATQEIRALNRSDSQIIPIIAMTADA